MHATKRPRGEHGQFFRVDTIQFITISQNELAYSIQELRSFLRKQITVYRPTLLAAYAKQTIYIFDINGNRVLQEIPIPNVDAFAFYTRNTLLVASQESVFILDITTKKLVQNICNVQGHATEIAVLGEYCIINDDHGSCSVYHVPNGEIVTVRYLNPLNIQILSNTYALVRSNAAYIHNPANPHGDYIQHLTNPSTREHAPFYKSCDSIILCDGDAVYMYDTVNNTIAVRGREGKDFLHAQVIDSENMLIVHKDDDDEDDDRPALCSIWNIKPGVFKFTNLCEVWQATFAHLKVKGTQVMYIDYGIHVYDILTKDITLFIAGNFDKNVGLAIL
jgi:hypothetical protein